MVRAASSEAAKKEAQKRTLSRVQAEYNDLTYWLRAAAESQPGTAHQAEAAIVLDHLKAFDIPASSVAPLFWSELDRLDEFLRIAREFLAG